MSEPRVSANQVVSITYSIYSPEGELLERSDLPVSYMHGGKNDMFERIEAALDGCAVGDEVQVDFAPGEAFGEHDPDLTFTDDLANVPPQFQQVGAQVEMQNDRGETKLFVVTGIEDGKLTVDGNHPFAGKPLQFRVRVESIREPSEEERRHGGVGQRAH